MNILIVRLSSIGDVVHTLPVLSSLRHTFLKDKIGWIVEDLSAPLLEDHPMIDHLFVIPKKRWRGKFFKYLFSEIIPFYKNLRNTHWDVAIDLQGLSKSGITTFLSGAKLRIGFGGEESREINRFFINKQFTPPKDENHIVKRNLSLLNPLGIKNPRPEFPFNIKRESEIWTETYFKELGWQDKSFIIINIGGGWETKRLSVEVLAETGYKLAKESSKNLFFVWGPGEEELTKRIAQILKEKREINWKIAPATNLQQLLSIIKRSYLFLGGDTGPTHIAGGLGIPVISFYGASDSRRNGPYSEKALVIQKFEFDCVPCWKTKCIFRDKRMLQCLRSISPEDFVEKAGQLLKESI